MKTFQIFIANDNIATFNTAIQSMGIFAVEYAKSGLKNTMVEISKKDATDLSGKEIFNLGVKFGGMIEAELYA